MAMGFGHLIGAWLAGKGYEYFSKKKISHYAWFFLLIGAILPDADFLIDWTLGTELHRTFTHSLLFVAVAPILVYCIFTLINHPEKRFFALAMGAGIVTHLLLDMFSPDGVPLLWPSLLHFSYGSIHYFDPASVSILRGSVEDFTLRMKRAILDMALGTAWILYLWWKKRIQF